MKVSAGKRDRAKPLWFGYVQSYCPSRHLTHVCQALSLTPKAADTNLPCSLLPPAGYCGKCRRVRGRGERQRQYCTMDFGESEPPSGQTIPFNSIEMFSVQPSITGIASKGLTGRICRTPPLPQPPRGQEKTPLISKEEIQRWKAEWGTPTFQEGQECNGCITDIHIGLGQNINTVIYCRHSLCDTRINSPALNIDII